MLTGHKNDLPVIRWKVIFCAMPVSAIPARLAASLIEKIPSILDEQDKGFSDAFGSTRPIPN